VISFQPDFVPHNQQRRCTMSDRALNHFGNLCHGDAPDLFEPGHPLSFDLLYQQYGEEGDGTDLGFDNHSDYLPIDEVPDFFEEAEQSDWSAADQTIEDLSSTEEEDQLREEFLESMNKLTEPVQSDECLCVGHCGCNHRNRESEVHSKKDIHFIPGRRSHSEQRRLARNRRISIRRMSDLQLIHLL
jgi:hypothetical protein